MIDPEFLKMLCCPETHQPLKTADAELVRALNEKIAAGAVRNRGGETVREPCDGGLVRQDGKYLYPIREEIPVLLVSEALPLS